jgi:hypothetical protein
MDDDSSLHFHVLQWASIRYHPYEDWTQREHKTQAKKPFKLLFVCIPKKTFRAKRKRSLLLGSKEPVTKKAKRKRLSLSLYYEAFMKKLIMVSSTFLGNAFFDIAIEKSGW